MRIKENNPDVQNAAAQNPCPQVPENKRGAYAVSFAIVLIAGIVITVILALYGHDLWFWNFTYTDFIFLAVSLTIVSALAFGGRAISGSWYGALVDSRCRVSLSKFQIALWTVIVISGITTVAAHNISVWHDANMDVDNLTADPRSPLDFQVPELLLVLMGLSGSVTIGSTLIKKKQADEQPSLMLAVLAAPTGPQFTDMFKDDFDLTRMDLAKIQMFYITIMLAFAYAYTLLAMVEPATVMIESLPSIEGGLVGLLAISHGTYLVHKGVKQ